ncbi:MAG: hypothetical protein AAF251_12950 [Pseudomonadota bacterium]
MTRVYITIDTEYSSGLVRSGGDDERADNFARSIACIGPKGNAEDAGGVPHQLRTLEETGQSAVFFVDPMPALLWGVGAVEDVVGPIIEAGQDVQLHLHTEWLAFAGANRPLASGRTGQNLFDFTYEEQLELIDYARTQLMAAGASAPIAFRAGNYGANDDTLRALAELGIAYDTSHCPALVGTASQISLDADAREPVEHGSVVEVPIASIATPDGAQRHGQITALSLAEMRAAILHAQRQGQETLTLVSHSFEFFNRKTSVVKHLVRQRFDRLCAFLRDTPGISSGTYRDHPPQVVNSHGPSALLPANSWRTGARLAEQALVNALYGRQ